MKKLGFCITGSFCSMDDMLSVLEELSQNYDIEVFVSPHVYQMDTRFYNHEVLLEKIENITNKKVHTTIQEAEVYGPKYRLDAVLVYPCDGNTLAKVALGINDNTVTMLIKSSLRNNVPIVLGIYSNDVLGNSGKNVMTILNMKGYYLVPMYQDDYKTKPKSMIACYKKVSSTLEEALQHKQIQPLFLGYKEV